AVRDAVGPIPEEICGPLRPQSREPANHRRSGLPGLQAAHPGLTWSGKIRESWRNLARVVVPELMAGFAAVSLDEVNPFVLALDVGRDAVAARSRARKFISLRHLEKGIPVIRRIVLRSHRSIRRDGRLQIDDLPRLALHLRGIYKAITARPNGIVRLRQIGKQVAATVVSSHFLDVASRQIRGFCDYPYPSFRPVGAGHDSADIVGANLRFGALRAQRRPRNHEINDRENSQREAGRFEGSHRGPPRNEDT